jgi:Pyridoxamine 5'-phosphate oxidase
MSELRSRARRASDVRAALERNGEGWLATASPAGRPHLIAVSAWWDGSQVVIATLGTSRTARNLDATGLARFGLGSPDDVILIDLGVSASVPVAEAGAELSDGFAAAVGWNPADEPGRWAFYRLRPLRAQAYRGYGELQDRDVMRDARWLPD